MFIPFIAATVIATTFANMGAMVVKVSVLTMALHAMLALCIALAALALWIGRRA